MVLLSYTNLTKPSGKKSAKNYKSFHPRKKIIFGISVKNCNIDVNFTKIVVCVTVASPWRARGESCKHWAPQWPPHRFVGKNIYTVQGVSKVYITL